MPEINGGPGDPVEPARWEADKRGLDPMPVFTIKGKDALAPGVIEAYRRECDRRGLHDQAMQVRLAWREVVEWQQRNPDRVKLPDHQHMPVSP